MELQQLDHFVQVARAGSFSSAASKCYISHQALSKSLASLERELGFQLFARSAKGLSLTENGKIMFQHASNVLNEAASMLSTAKMLQEKTMPTLSIGLMYDSLNNSNFLVSIESLLKFQEQESGTSVVFNECGCDQIIQMVERGTLDFGLVSGNPNNPELFGATTIAQLLFTHIVVANDNPLAGLEKATWQAIAGNDVLVPPNSVFDIRDIQGLAHQSGVQLKFRDATSNFDSNLKYVYENIGSVFISRAQVNLINQNRARIVPLEEPFIIPVCLIWSSWRESSRISKDFRNYFSNCVLSR